MEAPPPRADAPLPLPLFVGFLVARLCRPVRPPQSSRGAFTAAALPGAGSAPVLGTAARREGGGGGDSGDAHQPVTELFWQYDDFSLGASSERESGRFRRVACPSNAAMFCFPDLVSHRAASKGSKKKAFVFGLTDGEGRRVYGFSLRMHVPNAPASGVESDAEDVCVTLLSHYGWRSLFLQIVQFSAGRLLDGGLRKREGRYEREVLRVLQWLWNAPSLPSHSSPVRVPVSMLVASPRGGSAAEHEESWELGPGASHGDLDAVVCSRYVMKHATVNDVLFAPHFSGLLHSLGVARLLVVFAALLNERRVIVASSSLTLLTYSVFALCSCILPFCWQHIFIPVLPPRLLGYCSAPMPFLLGVHSSMLQRVLDQPLEDVLIVNLDSRYPSSTPPNAISAAPVAHGRASSGSARANRAMATMLQRDVIACTSTHLEDRRAIPSSLLHPLSTALDSVLATANGPSVDNGAVTKAFRAFFLNAIGEYKLFMERRNGAPRFDSSAFVRSRPGHMGEFYRRLSDTQMFAQWIALQEERARGRRCASPGGGDHAQSTFDAHAKQFVQAKQSTTKDWLSSFSFSSSLMSATERVVNAAAQFAGPGSSLNFGASAAGGQSARPESASRGEDSGAVDRRRRKRTGSHNRSASLSVLPSPRSEERPPHTHPGGAGAPPPVRACADGTHVPQAAAEPSVPPSTRRVGHTRSASTSLMAAALPPEEGLIPSEQPSLAAVAPIALPGVDAGNGELVELPPPPAAAERESSGGVDTAASSPSLIDVDGDQVPVAPLSSADGESEVKQPQSSSSGDLLRLWSSSSPGVAGDGAAVAGAGAGGSGSDVGVAVLEATGEAGKEGSLGGAVGPVTSTALGAEGNVDGVRDASSPQGGAPLLDLSFA